MNFRSLYVFGMSKFVSNFRKVDARSLVMCSSWREDAGLGLGAKMAHGLTPIDLGSTICPYLVIALTLA